MEVEPDDPAFRKDTASFWGWESAAAFRLANLGQPPGRNDLLVSVRPGPTLELTAVAEFAFASPGVAGPAPALTTADGRATFQEVTTRPSPGPDSQAETVVTILHEGAHASFTLRGGPAPRWSRDYDVVVRER